MQSLAQHTAKLARPRQQQRQRTVTVYNLEVTIRTPAGQKWHFVKDEIKVGKSSSCDLKADNPKVADHHLTLQVRGKQVFCRALVGAEEGIWGVSRTWLDGQQLRPGISYLLGNGTELSIGEANHSYLVEFPEANASNPMLESIMQV